jgi:hypothetical protein
LGVLVDPQDMDRVMSRNLRLKPHLRKWRGNWECMGMRGSCLGDTPAEAYQRLRNVEDTLTKQVADRLRAALAQRWSDKHLPECWK